MAVVGEAGDGQNTLTLAASTRPDVALVDVRMPDVDGIEMTRRLTESAQSVRVVLLSMYNNETHILHALQYGAAGFVQKAARPAELQLAVRAAARGDSFLCPSIARTVIRGWLERVTERDAKAGQLTRRQREVLELVAEGRTTTEIALQLGVGIKTVESHRGAIMRRLGAQNLAELVQEAVRMGLLTP